MLQVRALFKLKFCIFPLITYFRYHVTEYCAVIGTHSTVRGNKLLYGQIPDPFPRCGIGSGHARLGGLMVQEYATRRLEYSNPAPRHMHVWKGTWIHCWATVLIVPSIPGVEDKPPVHRRRRDHDTTHSTTKPLPDSACARARQLEYAYEIHVA